jgi:hypothetical protein
MTRRNFKSKIGIEKFLWIISERVVFQKNTPFARNKNPSKSKDFEGF